MARYASTVATRSEIAGRLRNQARDAERDHPGMQVHGHLRDAARQLERGNTHGAERHLRAAVQSLTPLNLVRHGHLEDQEHQAGKEHMAQLTRHLLQIKDVADTDQANENYRIDRRAMNAPAGNGIGRPSGTANGPAAPVSTAGQPLPARNWIKEGQQSAGPPLVGGARHLSRPAQQARLIDLVGPHGCVHGWHYVGAPSATGEFGAGMVPGSLDHIKAIDDLGTVAAHNAVDGRPSSDTLGNSLHNVARSLARRDIRGAKVHLASAKWANRHEASGAYKMELGALNIQGSYPAAVPSFNLAQAAEIYTIALAIADDPAIELSAQTARLATTPRPYGRPGGPGLYNVKGNKHSDYLENIVHALMTKRGFDKGKATAIARAAIRKWMRGGGHVHPEVRAAAGMAEGQEIAAQARAHAHANGSAPNVIELFNPYHGPAGRFTTSQNAQQPKGKQQGKGKNKQQAHHGHHAPAQHAGQHHSNVSRARQKGQLLMQARSDFQKAANLRAQLHAILAQLRSGKSGSTAASSGATKGSASSTKAAASSTRAASGAKAGASSASSSRSSSSSLQARAAALRQQISSLMAAGRAAQAQAARL